MQNLLPAKQEHGSHSIPWSKWGGGLLLILVYYAATRFHLRYVTEIGGPTTIWLPSGIGLVALMMVGRPALPLIALAAGAAQAPLWLSGATGLPVTQNLLHLLIVVSLETAKCWLAYTLWLRFVPNGIHDLGAALRFMGLVAILPGVIITPLLAADLFWAGAWEGMPVQVIVSYTSVALLGSILGILLVTPLYQAWTDEGWPSHRELARIMLSVAVLLLIQWGAFRIDPTLIYLSVPILLLLSLTSGSRIATVATLVLAVAAVGVTISSFGPLIGSAGGVTYLPLLVYLLVLVASSLVGRVQYSYVLRQRRELKEAVELRTSELQREAAAHTAAAEAALASERRFRALIEKAQEGIVLFDREGRIISIGASAIGRVPQPDVQGGEPVTRYVHPDDLPATEAFYAQVLANAGKTYTHCMRIQGPNGGYQWIEGVATNLLDDPAVGAVVVNYRDATERKLAEEQTAYQALLFSHISDAVIGADLMLTIRSWNHAAAELYGWPAAEVIGRSLPEITRIQAPPGRREQLLEILLHNGSWRGDITQLHRDGRPIPIHAVVTLVRDATGTPIGIVAFNRDMTEERRYQEALEHERALLAERVAERTAELQQLNGDLQRAVTAKDEFLASMSHELRTPLNAILMLAELLELETSGPLTPKQHKHLQTLRKNGQHLLELINNVLDLSKIQASKLAVEQDRVRVADLCEASLNLVSAQAERKRISIALMLDAAPAFARADGQRTKQILVNLLGNAVKFTPEEGSIGLKVTTDPVTKRLCFTVWDTGIGIEAADFEQLFEPFVQLEGGLSRHYEGSGLGLHLAMQLARLQGGDIQVTSEQGKGSEFTLWLPWEPESARSAGTGLSGR